ncbi:MAG: V-type ATP synthase subunit C [Clostridia bacterium]|nr:V-type ATP synthase subunit C [Clostridia bacterium]
MGDTKYAYSVARIRVLEGRLLDRARINRMIEAKDAQEAFKVLMETDYATLSAEAHDAHDYEILLSQQLKDVYQLIDDISPEPQLTRLFSLKYDVHNLKALLKSKYIDADAENVLIDIGSISLDKLKQMVKEKDYRDLPKRLKAAVEKIEDIFSVQPKPQMIDILLDRALYETYVDASAAKMSEGFLKDYFRLQADLSNIRTFFRVKRGGYGKDLFEQAFLPGGGMTMDVFLKMLEQPEQAFADKLATSDYGKVVSDGVEQLVKKSTLTDLEKYVDDYLIDYVKRRKGTAFGIEPLVGYILARENEIKNIRIIMVGKINELPEDVIRERLRDTYA